MSVDAHRRAEALMSEAEQLAHAGNRDQAARLYLDAAQSELAAYESVPVDRARTRGILAVGVVSLFRGAGDYAQAERHAHRFLADERLAPFAREQLLDLLDDVQLGRQLAAAARTLDQNTVTVTLRGSDYEGGTAPINTLILKYQQIRNFFHRTCELAASLPFRTDSRVPAHIENMVQVLVTEPARGSFRFGVRLASGLQPELPLFPDAPRVPLQQVSETFSTILSATVSGTPEELSALVPDDRYRETFVKMVRNFVPDGQGLREIEIRREGVAPSRVTVLTPDVGPRLTERYLRRARQRRERPREHVGILRALDLDEGWIDLVQGEREQRCHIEKETVVVDDVVGPFVNRMVRVPGRYDPKRRKFFLDDILPAEAGPNPS